MNIMSLLSNPAQLMDGVKQFEQTAAQVVELLNSMNERQKEILRRVERIERSIDLVAEVDDRLHELEVN